MPGSDKQGAESGIRFLLGIAPCLSIPFLSWQYSCTVAIANAGFLKVVVVMAKIA
jgi:hypothetical protein